MPCLNLLNLRTSKNASRAKEQNHNEKRERDCVAICRKSRSADKCFHHPKNKSANGGAGNIPDAAEHSCDKRFDSGQETHERIDRWIAKGKQNSGCSRKRAPESERERNYGI